MKKTGELLKTEREKRHISLNEISLTLKISTKILKAIEEGDPVNLPAKTFLRGFVQSYATALKLNSDEVLAVFYEEMGTTRPSPKLPEGNEASNGDATEGSGATTPVQRVEVQSTRALGQDVVAPMSDWSNKQKIAVFGGTLVLLLGIFVTRKVIEKYEREAEVATQVEVPAPLPNTEGAGDSAIPNVISTEAESTTPDDTSTANSAPPPGTTTVLPPAVTAPTQAVAPATTAPATVSPPPKAPTEVIAPKTDTPPVAKPTTTETPEIVKKPEVVEKKNTEVILEALDNVTVEFTNAEGKKESINLKADQVHTFKSKGLSLNISDGGAINIIVNGKDKGIPGNLGKPIKLSY